MQIFCIADRYWEIAAAGLCCYVSHSLHVCDHCDGNVYNTLNIFSAASLHLLELTEQSPHL